MVGWAASVIFPFFLTHPHIIMAIQHMLNHLNATRHLNLTTADLVDVQPLSDPPSRDGDYLVAATPDADIWRVATWRHGAWVHGVTEQTAYWVGLHREVVPEDEEPLEIWANRTLQDLRGKVVKGLADLSDEISDAPRAQGDEADISAARVEHESRLRAREVLSRRLVAVDAALKRLRDGEYGVCQATGEDIPRARLRIDPLALYTVEHQHKVESLGRRGMAA